MNSKDIQDAHLLQSKLYLKILGLSYHIKNTNTPMNSSVIKNIIKSTYIFNDIKVVSKLWVYKVLPKFNITIIWIDIWDFQNEYLAKRIINQSFNIGSFIIFVRGANINFGILQCKNCWKWGHTIFACCFQGFHCVKCNGLYKSKHYCYFSWCCKANFKMNPLHLKTKQGEPCLHIFKYLNCKGNYQADSNVCLF